MGDSTATDERRVGVRKMYKLFINGAFVRSESARSTPLWDGKAFQANIAQASRKDLRDAVTAARTAQIRWWAQDPQLRGLTIYRLGEMLEARRSEFIDAIAASTERDAPSARNEVDIAIDRVLWYAGWCDKYSALLSSKNPVAGPHFNCSTPEPMGVVGILAPQAPLFLGAITALLPPLVAGNAVILLASERDPRPTVALAEAIALSDIPPGVVNVLTGFRSELAPAMAKHDGIEAIACTREDLSEWSEIERESAHSIKRIRAFPLHHAADYFSERAQSLDAIADFCEIKTIWHPTGF
ncbi:MAG: aldehyde dehydrogenase family protein [Candidatus Eremiobacteraeota bacterium]|uniref:Putative ly membrane-anchored aldehyde dehydrogenase protein n=1 Tax=mine drainage metagenome TaxID=410659 RepID=E6PDR7_9ZZZZ|nr:aldehyde dehydrogenase family protein [Candidatus Eremiobacteraeota bacterium]